ncbi:PKD-like family lipoprotein [Chitinophaga sp.]|uniref:PKD-like family lipoprotein n=1 Tax=Chitinophaga sp. TaxID=1869181 RepID=UPI002F954A87
MKLSIFSLPGIIALFALVLCAGCYKDLGNYDYKKVNEIQIDTLPNSIFINQFDSLKLTPVIKRTMDQGALDDTTLYGYKWIIGLPDSSKNLTTAVVISTARVLAAKVLVPVGRYGLYLEIRDRKSNQIFTQHTNNLVVGSATYEGWLVLSDVKGNAQLDMITYANTEVGLVRNILEQSPDLPKPLKGPRKIAYHYTYTYNAVPALFHAAKLSVADRSWIYLSTEQGTWKLRSDYMFTTGKWNVRNEFLIPPDSTTFAPGFVGNGEGSVDYENCYIQDGKGNFYERNAYEYYVTNMNQVVGEGDFVAAPFLGRAFGYSWTEHTVLFDVHKKRFVRSYPGDGNCTPIPAPTGTALFDFDNVGMDLVWMKSMDYLDLTYAVMRDPAGAYWLLTFDARSVVTQNSMAKITAPDINKAVFFTIDKNYGTLFYGTDTKVYAVHKDFPDQYYQVFDAGNRKISWLDQHQFTGGKGIYNGDINGVPNTTNLAPYKANWLGIATYDPANPEYGSGTLSFYFAQDFLVNHAALSKKDEYPGFGKIVSVTYRERF